MKKVFIFMMVILALCITRTTMAASVHLLDSNGAEYTTSNPLPVQINQSGGTSEYSIKRTNIDPNTSVNLAFGFTAQNVFVYAANSNTQELIVDWLGGTAVAPSANTAGDFTLSIGGHMTKSDFQTTSISLISAGTGSQTVYVNAWR